MMQVNLNRITRLVTDKHEHHSRKYIRISTLNASGRDNDSLSLSHTHAKKYDWWRRKKFSNNQNTIIKRRQYRVE